MAKRKGGYKDTIYELENDDIEISSDDEAKEPKKGRLGETNSQRLCVNKNISGLNTVEVISLDSSEEVISEKEISNQTNNGGKTSSKTTTLNTKIVEKYDLRNKIQGKRHEMVCEKSGNGLSNKIIRDEDVAVDSPASKSDLGSTGCDNRTPLISVRFKDSKLAYVLKKTIKDFLINLLKSREGKVSEVSESENILDIWPEDLLDDDCNKEDEKHIDDCLFFVDTAPCDDKRIDIPKYSQTSTVICNPSKEEETPSTVIKRKQSCFNCDGEHQLRDCTLPRDNYRIAAKRKAMGVKMGRYHVEDEQKYGHLVPGRISASLRSALGLKRYELPLYIYRMRMLGYPPGWLEEARISHSGITMFDSTGKEITDPDDEEGELCEPGSKDKFDIKKILDFPGFNVPASSRYIEESHLYGLPPISEQDSKMTMLQILAPNAVKAYKRKKLLLFPSSSNNPLQGQAEMELDSGDEVAEFPSVPPLPDEAPPPAPPPPPPEPPSSPPEEIEIKCDTPDELKKLKDTHNSTDTSNKSTNKIEITKMNKHLNIEQTDTDGSSDVEIIEVIQVNDIPVPEDDLIIIDEDYSSLSQVSSGHISPSLDDLENKKKILLDALKSDVSELDKTMDLSEMDKTMELSELDKTMELSQLDKSIEISESNETVDNQTQKESIPTEVTKDDIEEILDSAIEMKDNTDIKDNKTIGAKENVTSTDISVNKSENNSDKVILKETELTVDSNTDKNTPYESPINEIITINNEEASKIITDVAKIPDNNLTDENTEIQSNNETEATSVSQASNSDTPKIDKAGNVKTTLYGTPVINIASSYSKLPTDDKFAKDICDVINFENLPNSTGKYKKICSLLKKVKTKVDSIQES